VIWLVPEVRSGLGEDTFWTWAMRELGARFDPPERIADSDTVLQYAVLGESRIQGGRKVALCWELYPEMQKQGLADNPEKIARMRQCAATSHIATVPSASCLEFFPGATVIPIGVDTELFRPRDQQAMRKKYGLADKTTGFWCGTRHAMKGHDRLLDYQAAHPDIQWVVVMKEQSMPQPALAELMAACDFALFTGRLRPYFMVEWEAMATGLSVVDISGMERDFKPSAESRADVIAQGWSRHQARAVWSALCA
jgi:hypothetical protein